MASLNWITVVVHQSSFGKRFFKLRLSLKKNTLLLVVPSSCEPRRKYRIAKITSHTCPGSIDWIHQLPNWDHLFFSVQFKKGVHVEQILVQYESTGWFLPMECSLEWNKRTLDRVPGEQPNHCETRPRKEVVPVEAVCGWTSDFGNLEKKGGAGPRRRRASRW